MAELDRLPLHDLHVALGARMGPFAGYEMPVQYPLGVMGEHLHCRSKAGLFDVSHMGQVRIHSESWDSVARAFETLVPQDVLGLASGRQRYGFFTNEKGGIEDDLMFARVGDDLLVVVNAACKDADIARMQTLSGVSVDILADRSLLALQGPLAGEVLASQDARAGDTRFMDVFDVTIAGVDCWASRSGYTGEDGFEISIPAAQTTVVAKALLEHAVVEPIGLGARDSLRLEAGLCLYGNDIDADTTVASAALNWAIQKARRPSGAREGGFPGADVTLAKPEQLRVGLSPEGRAPMRADVALFASDTGGEAIGHVTSGGFGPTIGAPVAMGYVNVAHAEVGTRLWGEIRGKRMPVTVASLPFVPANFKR
ncbi:MAG: glycine cleavage system aminomethyltransferase GcvT [Paracoccaceae bacterium]